MDRPLSSGPIVWLGIIVTTCLLLVLFQTALWLVMPILLAVIAYYLLSPLVNLAMARGITRTRAVGIVTVLMTIVFLGAGLSIAPKVSALSHELPAKLQHYGQVGLKLVNNARQTLHNYFPFLNQPPSPVNAAPVGPPAPTPRAGVPPSTKPAPTSIAAGVSDNEAQNEMADWQAKHSGDIAYELLRWIPSLLLVPYITYFFLLDGPRFKRFLVQAIPNAFFEKTLFLFYRVEDQLHRYFRGLLALTALDAFCLGVGLWCLGLNAPFVLAGLAAVMAWLPYLGSIGGCLLVVLVAASDFPASPWLPYEVVGLFIGVRLLDDFVFLPMTVGRSLQMHPLMTVVMILLAGAVAGISGLLLVMPVLGVVMVVGQIIGELVTDERVLARHRHAQHLRRTRARADLRGNEDARRGDMR
jgi:predicted PurR-regulated permease PerM